jgi:hypothetical protein
LEVKQPKQHEPMMMHKDVNHGLMAFLTTYLSVAKTSPVFANFDFCIQGLNTNLVVNFFCELGKVSESFFTLECLRNSIRSKTLIDSPLTPRRADL